MESARVSWVVRLVRGATVGAVSALLTFVSLLTPAPLFALHNNPTALEDGNLCSDCHNMSSNPGAVDAATSYLIANSRSLWNIRDANGGATTAVIGCTYCHFNNSGSTMKGVTNHWTAISRHPIGETFDGTGARTNTKNEWLSGYLGDTSAASGELDCIDCHAQALVDDPLNGDHTTHVARATRITDGNLYMLTGVAAAGEYDGFCRTCHGATAGLVKGIDVRVSSHNDGSDAGANAIKEADGTLLKTGANPNAKCSTCHVGHSSAGKKLFVATLDPSNGSKCTDCHENGDANNNFEAHGHGMNTSSAGNALNFSCTGCHGVNTAHDPSDATINSGNPKMLDYSEDTSTSVYGKSLRSICKNCHDSTKYTAHTGGSVSVGCIDCHDEHGEGSGAGSNRYMIPQNLPNNNASVELSFFQSAGDSAPGEYDYWVADAEARKVAEGGAMAAATNAGICDNSICHGASTPMNGLPLATFLNSGSHTGGPISPAALAAGVDCESCHKHTDSGGTWAANQACTSCHGQPPLTQATSASGYVFSATPADESKTPHARHAVATPAGYGFACTECHYQNVSSPPHNEATNSYASVWFDPASNPDATLYPTAGVDYIDASYTCNNIYCHSDGQLRQVGGSQKDGVTWMTTSTTPDWNVTSLLCSDCHGATNNTVGLVTYGAPDHANGTGGHTANSHLKHPYACAVCHNGTTQDLDPAGGWTLDLAGRNHVNGAKSLAAAPGYAFTPSGTTPATCNGISCHGGNNATWGGAALSCDQCHFSATSDLNNFGLSDGTPSMINSNEWMAAGHGRTTGYPSGNVAAGFVSTNASDLKGCLYCHDAAVPHATGTNPFRLRNNNALAQGLTAANAFGWNDACLVCHSALDGDGFDPDAAGGAYLPRNANKNIDQNHYGSKHSAGTLGGTFCWDCHDPHGDASVPQYMLQGTNGGSPGNGVTQTSDGTYGIPVTSRAVTGFDSVTGGFNSSDFVNGIFTGLCQTCHTTALYYNQTTNTALASHNGADTQRCTSCHKHDADFGASCSGCHGNSANGQMWPDGANTQGDNATADNAGAHERHMEALAQRAFGQTTAQLLVDVASSTKQKQLCEYCHAAVTNDDGHGVNANLPADVYVALISTVSTRFAKNLQATADANAAYSTVSFTCTNTDCHYATTATPSWYLGAPGVPTAGTCTTCHNNGTDNGAIANAIPTAGKHSQHGAAYAITTCSDCHNGFTPATMVAVATTATHIDANLYQVGIPNVAGAYKAQSAAVDPAYTGGATGTCSGVSCHGGQSIAWNAATPACANCHKAETPATEYNSASSGLHARVGSVSLENHTAADASVGDRTESAACNHCHNAPTNHYVGLSTTAMDAVNNFVTTYNGTGGSITNTTCAVTCHSDSNGTVSRWARKWSATITNTDGTECLNCHGMWGNWVAGITHRSDTGPMNQHGSPQTTPTWGCDECHGLNSAQYDMTPKWAAAAGDMHGDELIQVNSNSAANPLRLTGADAGETGCDGCHSANDGTGALQHSFTTVTRWGLQLIASANTYSGCTGCHGNAGTGQFWPDGAGGVPAYADDAAGAHDKHVNAIAIVRGWTTIDQKNQTCDWCHGNPGNPLGGTYTGSPESAHSIDSLTDSIVDVIGDGRVTAGGATFYNNAATRVADANGAYNRVTQQCSNIDCHGGSATPNWYTGLLADAVGPVFSPDNTITVSDTGTSQDLQISWNLATDALSEPVSYDLYRINNATTGDACVTGVVIAANLGTTAYFDSGLTNGTNYRYCVKAKDGVTPTPNGTNSTSAHAAPTAPAPGAKTYFLTRRNTGTIYGATTFNGGTCGTAGTAAAATTTPATVPYVVRGGLEEALFCAASAANYISNSSPNSGGGTAFENMLAFYTPTTYANTTVVTGAATGTSIWTDGSGGTEDVRVWLAASNPTTGALTPMSAAFNWTNIGTALVAKTGDLSGMSVTVPAGSRLAFLVTWADTSTTTSTNDRIHVDNMTTGISQIAVTEVPTDTVAPAFAADNSGITAVDAQTGGAVDLAWTAATDAFPSNPVRYTVYGVQSAAAPAAGTLFIAGNIKQNNILGTATTVTGLSVGNPWWFGVRATDAASIVETANVTISSPGVVPTEGGYGCSLCHGIPPSSAGNAGSHAAHANSDTTYTDCNKCHPGTTSYTSAHSDGVGQLAFDGSAVNGVYGAGLTYTDGAVIYNDADGYGTLTGTAGDGIDDGTCTGTGTGCHSAATPQWGNPATVACGSCHGTAARNYGSDPSTADDGAPPDDTLGAVTGTRVGKHLTHVNVSYSHTGNSCSLCHLNAGSGTAAHADGTPSGNGRTADVAFDTAYAGATATFTAGAPPTCTNLSAANCHTGSAQWDSAAAAFPCTNCHTIAAGKHMAITKGGADQACTACHPGGTAYPTKHSKNANANVIEIPTYTVVGITAAPGIHLGGDHTATKAIGSWGVRPTTEAEMCWFCHDQSGNAVLEPATEASEWSSNFGSTYNEGSISTARWIGSTWTSAQTATPSFAYKSAVINPDTVANSRRGSIHTAMTQAQGGPANNFGDTTAQIRCSYCHDVHDFNKAAGDTTSGRPWLRGQWKASPYKQDGAPQSGTAYPATTPFGAVPRARTINTHSMGGYWIDQNSNSPASAWTPAVFGGLCALCHDGTPGDDQDWTSAEIGTINVFGTNSDWVSGNNGHANSVKGGAGAGGVTARNIYNARGGTSTYATNGFAHFQGMTEPGNNGNFGFREGASFYTYTPSTGTNEGNPTGTDQWGVDETGVTLQNNYHQFSCSKCHVPHASRLPRLMKTNCLDTKKNTWDNTYQLSAATGNNLNRSISNWTSAQNCHRLGGEDPADVGDSAGTGAGWNNVTPW